MRINPEWSYRLNSLNLLTEPLILKGEIQFGVLLGLKGVMCSTSEIDREIPF